MNDNFEKEARRRIAKLEEGFLLLMRERSFYVQVIQDLAAAAARYQTAVAAKESQDAATISSDQAEIAKDEATIAQLGQNALTNDEVSELQGWVGKINDAAAALEGGSAGISAQAEAPAAPG